MEAAGGLEARRPEHHCLAGTEFGLGGIKKNTRVCSHNVYELNSSQLFICFEKVKMVNVT